MLLEKNIKKRKKFKYLGHIRDETITLGTCYRMDRRILLFHCYEIKIAIVQTNLR